MPEHKNQHYVPRCHFKPFSVNGEGNAINLLNLAERKLVRCAPIKGQCASPYIYGEDLGIEKALQRIEGEYARIIRLVLKSAHDVTAGDIEVLRLFTAVQYSRTETALRRSQEAQKSVDDAMFDGRPEEWLAHLPPVPDDREFMQIVMRTGLQTSGVLRDLKPCLIKNQTKHVFITSDDPVVFTSRFYFQRIRSRNFGLTCSGALLVLPLTPSDLLMFYDGNVYTIPEIRGNTLSITKLLDVLALNELQYIKASRNVYFSDFADAERIGKEFSEAEPRRPATWTAVHTFVPDETAPKGLERYRRATEEERITAPHTFLAVSHLYPEPSRWLSKLKYRSKPRHFSDGSAIGHVRKKEWLTSEGVDREVQRARPR